MTRPPDIPVIPRVLTIRKALGLNQWELARTLRVSKRTIVRWEKGEFHPHVVYIERLEKMMEEHERGLDGGQAEDVKA